MLAAGSSYIYSRPVRIQFYDALIVATAEKLGCHEIVTEDLNPNQTYRGMAVVNPFKSCLSPELGY